MASAAAERLIVTTEEAELRKKGYTLGSTLGEGSYAKVKSAHSDKEKKNVAIKIINQRRAPKDFRERFLPRELEILQSIHHENLVNLYEIFKMNGKVYICMEIAGHGDLLEYIKLRGSIPDRRSCTFFRNLLDGVEYLHSHNIVHRDLKCENLLLDVHNNIKISDFGFARRFENSETCRTFCGSAAYAAPEILQGVPYEPRGYDVWSMGVILYIMVCGSMPFDDSNIRRMIRDQTERRVGFRHSKHVTESARNLIHSILEADVSRRYKITEIRAHAWMHLKDDKDAKEGKDKDSKEK
ncbi:testis-specific serine/threonine-protein kinase 1-like [Watersipora subatra]|uniref:testis-specific serine/threonine-protein kinase 1-like n=1 Tax=Watersipora subatra TaxID=2589382 RepID=UPI00355BF6CF